MGVTLGGILGHSICTGAAVLGGRQLATHIQERTVLVKLRPGPRSSRAPPPPLATRLPCVKRGNTAGFTAAKTEANAWLITCDVCGRWAVVRHA